MDREKAIQILKRCEAESYCSHYKRHYCCIGCGQRDALDLAIKALERETEYGQMVVDFTKGETMKLDEWKYDTTCDAESATTTDCISRADTIKAMCAECEFGFYCSGDCTEVAVVKGMPSCNHTCNKKQVRSKLNNPDNSLLTEDSEACKEQESKLDCISRQQAIEAMAPFDTNHELRDTLDNLPPVTPTVSEDCISREEILKHAYLRDGVMSVSVDSIKLAPSVTPIWRTTETMIVDGMEMEIDPVSYEVGYTHGQTSPIERTGEWVEHDPKTKRLAKIYECPFCGDEVLGEKTNFCSNCGADLRANMGGDTE